MSHLPCALHSALQPGERSEFLLELDRETLLSTGSVLGANKGCVLGRQSALHADPKAERKATTPLFKTLSSFNTPSTLTPPSLNTQPPSIPALTPLKAPTAFSPSVPGHASVCLSLDPCFNVKSERKQQRKWETGRETVDQYSKCWTKNLLPAFPLTLESKQSSLLRDTYGPPLLQIPPFSSLLFKSHGALFLFHWLSWLSSGCVIPPSDRPSARPPIPQPISAPPLFTESQLPVLSYLEKWGRGQGREKRNSEKTTDKRTKWKKDGHNEGGGGSLSTSFTTLLCWSRLLLELDGAGGNNWLLTNNCALLIYNVKQNVSRSRPSDSHTGWSAGDVNHPETTGWLWGASEWLPHAVAGWFKVECHTGQISSHTGTQGHLCTEAL